MKLVLQRVSWAKVKVGGKLISQINTGLLIFLGIAENEEEEALDYLSKKVANLRIFPDDGEKMNKSILDIQGEILLISQFTILASCRKGNRPSFEKAANPEFAKLMYEKFAEKLKNFGINTKMGIFGENMQISLQNEGPVTIILDK